MVRKLFLISNFTENFKDYTDRFVKAAGGKDARIVFLMQGGKDWEKYYLQYNEVFQKSGPIDFFPIYPDEEFELNQFIWDNLGVESQVSTKTGESKDVPVTDFDDKPIQLIRSKTGSPEDLILSHDFHNCSIAYQNVEG